MNIDEQDIKMILDRVRAEFVTRAECDTQMSVMKDEHHSIDVRLAVIENEVKRTTKLQWTILVAVITAVVAAVMGLILK